MPSSATLSTPVGWGSHFSKWFKIYQGYSRATAPTIKAVLGGFLLLHEADFCCACRFGSPLTTGIAAAPCWLPPEQASTRHRRFLAPKTTSSRSSAQTRLLNICTAMKEAHVRRGPMWSACWPSVTARKGSTGICCGKGRWNRYLLWQGTVEQNPKGVVSSMHYEDAARLLAAVSLMHRYRSLVRC
jgi:hypothetical protein